MPKAEKYALKALELDPNLAHAHLALAAVRFYGDWDWAGADREFKLAIELNPSDSETHRSYAFYLSAMGRAGEALAEINRAEELDPLDVTTQITSGWVFYFARKYDLAVDQCRKSLEFDPNYRGKHLQLVFTVDDAGVFTMPWTATITYSVPVGSWEEHVCAENRLGNFSNGREAAVPVADRPDF